MANDRIIRTVEIREEGAERTAASLDKLATAGARAATGLEKASAAAEKPQRVYDRLEKSAEQAAGKTERLTAANEHGQRVFERQARSVEGAERGLNRLQRQLDPMHRAAEQFAKAQDVLDRSMARGLVTQERYADLLGRAQQRFDSYANQIQRVSGGFADYGSALKKADADARAANDNIRLTGGQIQNLGYQLNDVSTMLLMGASPFQILASQGGQVVQALGDGPGGVRGSLTAIGSAIAGFARAIPGAAYAVAGVTAAVGALYYATRDPAAREAEESVASFEQAVKRLGEAWAGAGAAAEEHFERARGAAARNPAAAILDVAAEVRKLQADYKAQLRDLNFNDTLPEQILRARSGGMSESHQEIRRLYGELLQGDMLASQFSERMLAIRLDPNADDFARAFADAIRLAIAPAVELEQRINGINDAAAKLGGRGGRVTSDPDGANPFDLRDRFGGVTGMAGRLDPEGMDAIRQGLAEQKDQILQNEAALRTYSDAVEEQKAALAGSIAELRLQVDMFGQSEGAIAAARFRMEALAEAQRQATAANEAAIDPSLAAQIEREAAEYGRLTDRIAENAKVQQERLRVEQEANAQRKRVTDFEGNLAFDRSIATLPQAEQEVRTALRNLGVDFESFEGQRLAGAMRYNAAVRAQQEELRKTGDVAMDLGDVFADIFSSATRDGESFFASVVRGLAGLGSQLAAAGARNIFGNLFGTGPAGAQRGGIVTAPAALTAAPAAIAPAPTATMRQASAKLAEDVTTSVSDNLLRNMLSAGKSQEHVTGLNREFATALTTMFGDAPAAVRSAVSIYSGFRSVERQAQLFAGAVKKYGSEAAARKWVAPPGRSNHNRGLAADLDYSGSASAREWVHQNASRYGLKFPMSHENWHIELAGARGGARTIERATSAGVKDALQSVANDRWGGMRESDVTPSAFPQMTMGQAGMGALFGLGGIAAQGYQSGNPLMGGLSGLMGGAQLASQFGGALGLGAAAGPVGMAVGTAVGALSAPIGRRRGATGAEIRRHFAEYNAKKESERDGD